MSRESARAMALTPLPLSALVATLLLGCAQPPIGSGISAQTTATAPQTVLRGSSVFGATSEFLGSPHEDIGRSGLFPVRPSETSAVAILRNGEDSFAARIDALRNADTSVRIQALVFEGDESGLYIAEILKEKQRAGLDVRVIVDAFSNPSPQTQWMLFDLKQNGIEVEGYEAMGLQWINEVPVPNLLPHYDPERANKRFHEKLWIVDGETDHAVAVVGGLNIGNAYFRVDPSDPDGYWRDQDVMVRGVVVKDMVAAFDRNFEYFLGIKESRGIFNTDRYWAVTRAVLGETGPFPVTYETDLRVVANVETLAQRPTDPDFESARCRFFQSRPRFRESYIEQAYLKLIAEAREEILIANAYFVPTEPIVAALKAAARRCVAIVVITNSPDTNDLPEISMVGRGHFKDILQVNTEPAVERCLGPSPGIQIWEWHGHRRNEAERTEGTMHSKYAVFDRTISLVGSYNLDPRSERLNSESALVFASPRLAQQLAQTFLLHDLDFSRRVTLEQAQSFADPGDVIYRFRKTIGDYFEDQL